MRWREQPSGRPYHPVAGRQFIDGSDLTLKCWPAVLLDELAEQDPLRARLESSQHPRGAGKPMICTMQKRPGARRHLETPSSASASSAKPCEPREGVTQAGMRVISSSISRTFATPTALGKNSNIGWSLGESPAKTKAARAASTSMANSSRIICRVVESLS